MSYEVLARKWRPHRFDELVGQEHVVRALVNALDDERLHHAYLFTGTRGVGKTTIARRLYPVYPIDWLLKDRYQSVRYAAAVTAPAMLLIAEHDRVIPPVHSSRLAEAFDSAPVDTVIIQGADHNSIAGFERYWAAIVDFLGD